MQELRLLQGAWNDLMRAVCEDAWFCVWDQETSSRLSYTYCSSVMDGKRAASYLACQADSAYLKVALGGYSTACRCSDDKG